MLHHIENHLETMRKKPDHVKKQYAFGVSFCFTLIVFGFWLAGMRPNNHAVATKSEKPIQALTASAGDAFNYFKTFFASGNKVKYEDPIEVLPGK